MRSPALALLAAVAATPAAAQTWRTVTSARQVHGERELSVDVAYAAGQFRLAAGLAGTLYRMELRYDEDRFVPLREYDAESGVLRLGTRSRHGTRVRMGERRRRDQPSSLDLELTPSVPLALTLQLGAAEADVDLGGLALRSLSYRTGASQTSLRFSLPNPLQCEELVMEAGAAEFRAVQIANANCRRVRFRGGVGDVTLDFGGRLRQSLDADIDVGVGSLKLRLPREVGVAIRLSRFLASFSAAGFTKRGNTYYSDAYAGARQRITLNVNAAIGGIQVDWVGP